LEEFLSNIAKKIGLDLGNMSGEERRSSLFDILGLVYSTPLGVVGIVWLIASTDIFVIRSNWFMLAFIFLLQVIFERLDFYNELEIIPGTYTSWQSSLGPVFVWSGALIFGPAVLWLFVLWWLIWFGQRWMRAPKLASRFHALRNFTFNIVCVTFAALVGLTLYQGWLGNELSSSAFPLPGLNSDVVLPALGATIVWWFLSTLVWLPLFVYYAVTRRLKGRSLVTFIRYWGITTGAHLLVDPFAVLAAGLYTQLGLGVYLFFIAGLLLASFIAHELSRAVKSAKQRTREVEQLEQFGRAILTCCPDVSYIAQALNEHVPFMFPNSRIEIFSFKDSNSEGKSIFHHPQNGLLVEQSALDWLRTKSKGEYFRKGTNLPWKEEPSETDVWMTPIFDIEHTQVTGGIFLSQHSETESGGNLLPAIQTLAAQITSAQNSAKVYKQTIAHQRMEHELHLAGKIQEGILPENLPPIKGWQLVAAINPARETSGDFYDFMLLPDGRLGLLIADVSDKGVGAAMFMALSRTLIRTFAFENSTQPELTLAAANRRLLLDTHTSMFITSFYGILDQLSGSFTYCNAGHNPPLLIRSENKSEIIKLNRTGMALGIQEDIGWESKILQIDNGDTLLFYTDGITDAQNLKDEFFGEQRLEGCLHDSVGLTAQKVKENILATVGEFVGNAPQADDITLLVLVRDP